MISIIYTTTSDFETAENLARGLISKQLVACVQIDGPIRSIYPWQGKIEMEEEFRLTIKCLTERYSEIEKFIKQHHPYDTPEIVSVSAQMVSKEYENWITKEAQIKKGKNI